MSDAVDKIHQDNNAGETKIKGHFVETHICSTFRSLGMSVGRHPLLYCLVPLVVAIAFSVRICWVRLTKDVEYLYSPINGRSIRERDAIESIFPLTSNSLDPLTITQFRTMAILGIESKDGGNLLREDVIEEITCVDVIIRNITITHANKTYTYADLCSKQYLGECQSSEILKLQGKIDEIRRKQLFIKYPAQVDEFNRYLVVYADVLGGVTTDKYNNVVDAKAMRLFYILDHTTTERETASLKWEESFKEVTLKLRSDTLKFTFFTSKSIDKEFNRITEMILPMLLITGIIMVSFAIISCMTLNWLTSKPWVAIASCISPMLGVGVTFGFLLLCGIQYVDLNITILFLLIGIGLDDSFVILAAWRRTDSKQEVDVRMSQTYEEAGLSITITSITNILSLCVGLTIPYRIVRIFCTYAATSMFMAYIYQITFYGGVLALSGYREKKNLHPLLCITIKKETRPNLFLLKFLYFGCSKDDDTVDRNNLQKSKALETFLTVITTIQGKSVIIVVFLLYLTTSIYCLKFVKESFDYRDAIPSNSYMINYLSLYYKYFTQYPNSIHIVINKTLDYSDNQVQVDIENMMQNFSTGQDMASGDSIFSWLKYFIGSTRDNFLKLSYNGYNMSHPNDFIEALKNVFLKFPFARSFQQHIRFNHNQTEIVASRFIIFSKDIDTSMKQQRLISTLWSKADSSKYPTYISNPWFPLYNVLLNVLSSSLETMCTAAIIVTVVFFIFIPHLFSTIGIMLTILSIQTGVVGYMSLWNVPFNPISMICIVMSIGFSVDYTAHVTYAYLSCKEESPDEKTKVALRKTGYPIIQGCVSTVLGIITLKYGPSGIFLIFYKIVILVMSIAIFHGLFIIPVMLNILDGAWRKLCHRCQKNPQELQVSCDNKNRREESLLENVTVDEIVAHDYS